MPMAHDQRERRHCSLAMSYNSMCGDVSGTAMEAVLCLPQQLAGRAGCDSSLGLGLPPRPHSRFHLCRMRYNVVRRS